MTKRRNYAVGTGLFIVLGFAALAYLATQTTSLANFHGGSTYTVKAQFADIGALKERAPVKIAGVRVGDVESIALDPGHAVADVTLAIDRTFKIPVDSVAVIYTSGLLGDQYVGINSGHANKDVKGGGTLALTRSSQPLEAMISKFFGAGGAADNLGGTYEVIGSFTNVGSLSAGAPVKMAGVAIGSVTSVRVDPVKLDAVVTVAIDKKYSDIPNDSSAAVFTSGLIGSQYLAVQPGGSPEPFRNGDQFILTQSAIQLEDLIGKFMVGGSGDGGKSASGGDSSSGPSYKGSGKP